MSHIIVSALQPSQAREATIVNLKAFADSSAHRVLYPNGLSESSLDTEDSRVLNDLATVASPAYPGGPTAWYAVATDASSSTPKKLLAMSVWFAVRSGGGAEDPLSDFKAPPDADPTSFAELLENCDRARRETMAAYPEHMYLAILATAEEARRRGCGAALLRWGKAKARELGLPCYLQATAAGKSLYLREGWREIRSFEEDYSRWLGQPPRTTMETDALMLWKAEYDD